VSNLSFPFKFPNLVRDEEVRSASRAGGRRQINLETLEGRALLSHVLTPKAAPYLGPAVDVAPAPVHLPVHPHPGPIVNNFGVGYAVKSPRFYEFYKGAHRAELNAAGMKATYDAAGNLVLTGIVAGPITQTPTTTDASEYYVFGIDRGLSGGLAPFPGRPRIRYDALVGVAFTPGGVAASVLDLHTNTVTNLSPSAVVVQGGYQGGLPEDFKVWVPAGTPGITGPVVGAANPKVVFWAQDALPTASPNPADIASFAPDGRSIPIAGGVGQTPPHHLR
jgi:hypothetical protein